MFVVDLHCGAGHDFEGWFASADDLANQQARGLVTCPVCGGLDIVRRPSASRLNVSSLRDGGGRSAATPTNVSAAEATPPAVAPEMREMADKLQAMYLQVAKQVVASTEDVGNEFAETARRIHQGEEPERAIRGQATQEEREALREEGIEVMSIAIPKGLDGPLQ